CHVDATCTENFGGFVRCSCKAGFTGDGLSCSDIDECTNTRTHGCSLGACHNTIGSYYCTGSSDAYSSSDPCTDHIVLNEPWRSKDHITTGAQYCDSDKRGWYRFVGSGGTQMPEVCVPTSRCQTDAPLWLNGQHPAIGDGIVDRTVCGHWLSSCCKFSGRIQIKACPGGYYVYGINGVPECSLTYCTGKPRIIQWKKRRNNKNTASSGPKQHVHKHTIIVIMKPDQKTSLEIYPAQTAQSGTLVRMSHIETKAVAAHP
ncbi:hypothetical protein AB205_0159020, partial [Aquarana catesbeiana]